MDVRLTKRQKLVLRMLSLTSGGTSMAYLVYSLTGQYLSQTKGEVPSWKNTFVALCKRRLVVRRFDYTHWNWSLRERGLTVVHGWLVRARKRSLGM
jgi:membrane protein YdbS with pleckstrin-like domain